MIRLDSFRRSLLRWLSVLLIFTIGFPFVIYLLVYMSSCGGGDGCGALAAVAGMFLKPVGIITSLLGLIYAASRRIQTVGMSSLWTFAMAAISFAALPSLVMFGNFWGANFGMGLLFFNIPTGLLFIFAILIFLAFNHGWNEVQSSDNSLWWKIASVSIAYMLLLSLRDMHSTMTMITIGYFPFDSKIMAIFFLVSHLAAFGFSVQIVSLIAFAIFIVALIVISLNDRGAGNKKPTSSINSNGLLDSSKRTGFGKRQNFGG